MLHSDAASQRVGLCGGPRRTQSEGSVPPSEVGCQPVRGIEGARPKLAAYDVLARGSRMGVSASRSLGGEPKPDTAATSARSTATKNFMPQPSDRPAGCAACAAAASASTPVSVSFIRVAIGDSVGRPTGRPMGNEDSNSLSHPHLVPVPYGYS